MKLQKDTCSGLYKFKNHSRILKNAFRVKAQIEAAHRSASLFTLPGRLHQANASFFPVYYFLGSKF